MSEKTIALISSGRGGSSDFWSRLHDALVDVGCRVEAMTASESKRILDLMESGAVPVVGIGK